jgi:sugar O-acyltransferase (sialic acid O-acetyltransferase NeuD family)
MIISRLREKQAHLRSHCRQSDNEDRIVLSMKRGITPNRNGIDLVVFGGRGGGAVATDSARRIQTLTRALVVHGFLNDHLGEDELVEGLPVLGKFADWQLLPDFVRFVAPLHKYAKMHTRAARIAELGIPGERWCSVVDPGACVSGSVSLGTGTLISAGAHVQPACQVGNHVAIRQGAVIGHNSAISDHAFVGANSTVCGYATIGTGAYLAPGCVVRDGVKIGEFATVGVGAVVLHDVEPGSTVIGNPASVVRMDGDQPAHAKPLHERAI